MAKKSSGQVCTLVLHVRFDDRVTDANQLATFFDRRLQSTPANELREAGIYQFSPPACEGVQRRCALYDRSTQRLEPETFDSVTAAERACDPNRPLTIVSFAWEPDGRGQGSTEEEVER